MLLLLAGCQKDGQAPVFEVLKSSNLGLGLAFDMEQSAVASRLGAPQTTENRLGGKSKVDYYIPAALLNEKLSVQPVPSPDKPQLAVSYFEGKLRKLYNKWVPTDSTQPEPPFYLEPVQGVKLGARKSDMTTALGTPVEKNSSEWMFKDQDGYTITISATFVRVESANEDLCDSLLVVYAPPVVASRGEDMGD